MTLHQLDQYADLNIAQRISMLPDVGQVLSSANRNMHRRSS
jgi:hypothetical protein